jgi:eukaryotic-like serine/threonine-protein kinase
MEVWKLGKYEVRATIGRGAVGTVYEAWDPLIARTVAIKVLPLLDTDEFSKEQQERFRREAQAAGRLHHPNIVSAFDYGETESSAYIVMEYLPGPSLKTLLAKREPLPLADIGRIMQGLLSGLRHSHQRGVVHRDIKPGNVVFSAEGDVKITDFGIAHLEASGLTRDGSVIGTPAYMAPEQVLSEPVDARTDIYSAGVVLYEMLTGRRPFQGSEASILHRIVHLEPARPSDLAPTLSPDLDTVTAKALAKQPGDRFQTAAEFDQALRAALRHASLRAAAPQGEHGDATEATVAAHNPAWSAPSPSLEQGVLTAASRRSPRRIRSWLLPAGAAGAAAAALVAWLMLVPHASRQSAENSPSPPSNTSERRRVAADLNTAGSAGPMRQTPTPAVVAAVGPATMHPLVGQTDSLRQQIDGIVAEAPCSIIASEVPTAQQVVLRGISALGIASVLEVQAVLQRSIQTAVPGAAVNWSLRRIDGPFCPVLELLRPLVVSSVRVLSRPTTRAQLTDGDSAQLAVSLGQRPVRIALDRFTNDGTVHHLLAGPTGESQQNAIDSWRVGKPYGDQLITAILTSAPLFARERPEHEPSAGYVKDLQAALAQLHGQDKNLEVDALGIEVAPK